MKITSKIKTFVGSKLPVALIRVSARLFGVREDMTRWLTIILLLAAGLRPLI